MAWYDFFRLFSLAFNKDPISIKNDPKSLSGAGHSGIDLPNLRGDDMSSGTAGFIRVQNDLIDLNSTNNRMNRNKEYDRLVASIPEIDMAMTVFADEACVAEGTEISTLFHGSQKIEWLAQHKANERFAVHCYDTGKDDYTIGWAFNPRLVKSAPTINIMLDNGKIESVTEDHRILLRDGSWKCAGDMKFGMELMPFYRIPANHNRTKVNHNQFPRIYTHKNGWVHERQYIDEWRLGKSLPMYHELNKIAKLACSDLTVREMSAIYKRDKETMTTILAKHGFSYDELKYLHRTHPDRRRVVGMFKGPVTNVYDLSVEDYENFCTKSLVMHNCQKNEKGHVFKIECEDQEIVKELEFLFFNRGMLHFDQMTCFDKFKRLCIKGDAFWELIVDPDNPKGGVCGITDLPPETMFRIETTRNKLLEFQQAKEGPDYEALKRSPMLGATEAELAQSFAIRFAPTQVIHTRLGDFRRNFYPYGVSLIEAARGPAHQLRMMEDAMVVVRLVRSPERRVFYIDVGTLPNAKAEAFMDRIKDQFRKKKVGNSRGGSGVGIVDEKWHAPPADEDIWLPIRGQSNTKIDVLPGACLALNTKIPLLDGRVLTLQEVIAEYENGQQLWAYSCCPETGKFSPGLISWAGVTRKDAAVVKVTFDNGESIICTPDHKFPVQTLGKVEAKDLKPGDSMFPFATRLEHINKKKPRKNSQYLQIYDNEIRDWKFVHRIVMKSIKYTKFDQFMVFQEEFKDHDRTVIHHKNHYRFNNAPDNLAWMNWRDHFRYHRQFITNQQISEAVKAYHANMTEEQKAARDIVLREKGLKGNASTLEKLKDPVFNVKFRQKQKDGWSTAAEERPELHKLRGEKITQRNLEFWSNEENKKRVFEKQTVIYPEEILKFTLEKLAANYLAEDIALEISNNKEFVSLLETANPHIIREDVNFNKFNVEHVRKMLSRYGYDSVRTARTSVGGVEEKSGRPRLSWPKPIMDEFIKLLKENKEVKEILASINSNQALMATIKFQNLSHGFDRNAMNKMLKYFGYTGLQHAREQAANYNHKVVSVEFLTEKMDTGTLTIDNDHLVHNYHTFSLCFDNKKNDVSPCGIYTCNSNLGEIDDTVYFRSKLFTALNFPKNYFALEDVGATRITLSAQDVKFARLIERLQSYFEYSLMEVAIRHLYLRGYPSENYEDLQIKMTAPSEWRELSRAEIVLNRINYASSLKSAMLLSDYDILTEWMKYTPDEANERISRNKMQKMEDLKLQILAQNPILLGVGVPGAGGKELSAQPGGPNPMLGPDQAPPEGQPGQQPPPEGQPPPMPPPPNMMPPAEQAKPLPNPTDEEISRYDLDMQTYDSEMDRENIDFSEN